MLTTLRIATFNLENLDVTTRPPLLAERVAVIRPQLERMRANILCLQEVHSQKQGSQRALAALDQLLQGTAYASYHRATTTTGTPPRFLEQRNLVVLSEFPIAETRQYQNTIVPPPSYRMVTAVPPAAAAQPVTFERPTLHARVTLPDGRDLHVLNVHLKSKLPTTVPGQTTRTNNISSWKTAGGWAEGSFLSAMKRVGQALEVRAVLDGIFNADAAALVALCGDFNADHTEVSIECIRGEVEDTENPALGGRVMVPCELSVPEPARFSLIHHGRGVMLDHVLASRGLLRFYRGTEIHNELLHDESVAFATDIRFPESDHAPVIAEFALD